MRLPAFDFHAPTELSQVFALLAAHGDRARVMAGGTDLLVAMKLGKLDCDHVVSLRKLSAFDQLTFDAKDGLTIGAITPLEKVGQFAPVRELYGVLVDSIVDLATVQVRHKGTVIGNLCNASPAADTATPLMALGAEAHIVGPAGERRLLVEQLLTGPGKTALAPGELVQAVRVPAPATGTRAVFLKHSTRSKVDIASTIVTAIVVLRGGTIDDVQLFLGSVAPTPLRAVAAERLLRGKQVTERLIEQVAVAARDESRPITDLRGTKEYKRQMVHVLTRRALTHLTRTA